MTGSKPVLWQIEISHYSEKVRWALDHKRVDHVRRSTLPGVHIPVALWLSRGAAPTFPVLELGGRAIADSTAAIAALEQSHPQPPLYPADPAERARALELEDFFDTELGPHARLLPFYELTQEPEMFAEIASESVPGPLGQAKSVVGLYARGYTAVRWGARNEAAALTARDKIVAALDRVEAELEAGGDDYLVGDSFTVADLTAASLFYPVVTPAEGPLPPGGPVPPALEQFRSDLSSRPGIRLGRRDVPPPPVAGRRAGAGRRSFVTKLAQRIVSLQTIGCTILCTLSPCRKWPGPTRDSRSASTA